MRFRPALAALALALASNARTDTWAGAGLVSGRERIGEAREKSSRIMGIMKARGLDAIILTKFRNQAWALAGSDTRIVHAQAESPVWLLYTANGRRTLVSDNIEAKRLMREEGLSDLGFSARIHSWMDGLASGKDPKWASVESLVGGGQVGTDRTMGQAADVSGDLARARFPLTETEKRRMRWLGARCGRIAGETCREIAPGMREDEIAGLVSAKLAREGINPTVVLVGVDDRLTAYRHLTPTRQVLKRYALVNLCAERWGLVVAVSRLVHFGPLPPDLDRRMKACAYVDAAALSASVPGAKFRDVFRAQAEAYGKAGFANEWRKHHQGGAIGYFEREFLAAPGSEETVVEGMALAWNPTIAGVKVEDTVLVGRDGVEILTDTPDWPMIPVEMGVKTLQRPGILVRPPR